MAIKFATNLLYGHRKKQALFNVLQIMLYKLGLGKHLLHLR